MGTASTRVARETMNSRWLVTLGKTPHRYLPNGFPVHRSAAAREISVGNCFLRVADRSVDDLAVPSFTRFVDSRQTAWLADRVGLGNALKIDHWIAQGIVRRAAVLGAVYDLPHAFPGLLVFGLWLLMME